MAVVTPFVLAACYGAAPYDDTAIDDQPVDLDEDGYESDSDCDDADANTNPGATEICDDGIDNDCDSKIDMDDSGCTSG